MYKIIDGKEVSASVRNEIKAEVEALGVRCIAVKCDVADNDSIKNAVAEVVADFGRIDILVNNAGCGYLGNFDESEPELQLRMTDLNIRAMTAVTHTVLPFMPKGSHIINISSIASFVPNVRMTVYSATKAYVSFFSRGLHEELKPRGISVTAVCPGPMNTEFIAIGGIKGRSKTFDILPYCDPVKVVRGALKAAKKGRAVYTPRLFYKFYRVLSGLIPHAILVHAAKT